MWVCSKPVDGEDPAILLGTGPRPQPSEPARYEERFLLPKDRRQSAMHCSQVVQAQALGAGAFGSHGDSLLSTSGETRA